MKPKDFIEKYNLNRGWKTFIQDEFLTDMTSELLALLETYHDEKNIKGFDNAVNVIRMKWDAISKKIPYGIPEKLWGYYFATTIAKIREQMFPKEMAKRREDAEKRKAEWERRKAEREYWNKGFDYWERLSNNWYESFFFGLAMEFLKINRKPTQAFATLGLDDNATVEDVQKAYRTLSMEHHPDRGGDKEKFIAITEAKNKCLNWLNNNNK